MNQKTSLLQSWPVGPRQSLQARWPARRGLASAVAGSALLFGLCCGALHCSAQDPTLTGRPETSAVLGPKRLFPREALQLPSTGGQFTPPRAVVRKALDGVAAPSGSFAQPEGAGAPTAPVVQVQESADLTTPTVTDQSYRLTENDQIKVTVFQEPDLSVDVRIGKDGTISMPYIGTIRVAGKTVREATRIITELLDDGYLVHPQVNLSLLEFSKRQFTILGEVRNPGRYTMLEDQLLTLEDAVAMAGGWGPSPKKSKVVVTRLVDGKNQIYTVDGMAFRDRNARPFLIQPDDTIFVAETFF